MAPPGWRYARLAFAYLIGMNVFGLFVALTYAVGSLLHMMTLVGPTGLLAGISLGVLAGWRTEKALKRLFE
jgi:hypothetical protein